MIERFKGLMLMDPEALAHLVRRLRKEKGLTLKATAERLVKIGYADQLSSEMVRRAEDPTHTKGTRIFDMRIAIIEDLGGRKIRGPLWVYEDELA